MRILAFFGGAACVLVVLLDAFQTIILPRRAGGRLRLTRLFYISTWRPWASIGGRLGNPRRREKTLSIYGPLSLILLLVVWAGSMLLGFGLLFFALGSPFADIKRQSGLATDLYVSGTTIFTLGLGDVTPQNPWARALVILESGLGLGFLAVVMGYFPVLYTAFSRREVSISLLDSRAGSPPTATELIRRHSYPGADQALSILLREMERWSAELLESHISYPQLCYFRSQHTSQSWLAALTAILDASSLMIAGILKDEARQAQLTFAIARHALVDLTQVLSLRPLNNSPDRLPADRYEKVCKTLSRSGATIREDDRSFERLSELRALYEGYAEALSRYLYMPLPPWLAERPHKDDWLTVARERAKTGAASPRASDRGTGADTVPAAISRFFDHHDF
jgi:hypothetical protein